MNTKIVYSEKCLGYGTWHIEGPQRVKIAHDVLAAKGYEFVEPIAATEEQILSVHDMEYVFNLKKGLVEDSDTPAYDKIFDFAQLSAGAALLASKIGGFSITRPPGHHVGKYGAALGVYTRGFCYLNNIAIAVKESGKKTLILRHRWTPWQWHSRDFLRRRKRNVCFGASVAQLSGNRPNNRGELHQFCTAAKCRRRSIPRNTRCCFEVC